MAYKAPDMPPPSYPAQDAGPYYPPQQGGYGSPPPPMGGPGPYGPPPGQDYYGGQQAPYQQQPMQYQQQPMYQQQGYPPPGQYQDDRGRGSSGSGICAGIMGALACCCCLDCLF